MKNYTMVPNGKTARTELAMVIDDTGSCGNQRNIDGRIISITGGGVSCTIVSEDTAGHLWATVYSLPDGSPGRPIRIG